MEVSGAGGWITFISGVGERGGIEFSLGGVGHAEVNEEGLFTNQVDMSGSMPILLGFQYPLFKERNFSAFQPYISAGGGPYILSRVQVIDSGWDDYEVTVKNRVRSGVYGAAGVFTAFVDVKDPEASQGHVYLLFNTGLAPDQGTLISAKKKRTIVRENLSGTFSI